jgi:hypothetical protein
VNKVGSHFLFATPTLVSGSARVLDLYGVYDTYNDSPTDHEADYKAALSDWSAVGRDLYSAMEQFERSLPASGIARQDEPREADRQMSLSFFS